MSTLEIVRYYSDLLIIQYHGKPRARATVELQASSDVMPQTSVQVIAPESTPSAGQLVLSYDGVLVAAIEWDDTQATIQTKLQAVPALATVTVIGSFITGDGTVTVTFTGVPPPAELLEIESNTFSRDIDGGDAFTTVFADTIDGGSASVVSTDTIDGGDAFGTGPGIPVDVTLSETDEILPLAVLNGYNLVGDSTAVGHQLDVIAKYVGVSRIGVGFSGQQIILTDEEFLTLIQIGIVRNSAKALLFDIQNFLIQFFGDTVMVFDYQNMRISYLISTAFGSQNLVQMVVTQGLLPKPMAVQLASAIYAPTITTFFGFRTYWFASVNNTPFNSYGGYQLDRPWLTYANAV